MPGSPSWCPSAPEPRAAGVPCQSLAGAVLSPALDVCDREAMPLASTDGTATGALSPYRVLDLTEGTLSLAGKLLADLGADVIKIEKPGGDDARSTGPFYDDVPDRSRSLFWWAYNVNKRAITLNLDAPEGRQIFLKLAQSADFIIESFPPGFMDR